MKLTSNGTEQMKLLDYNLPPLAEGSYRATAKQTVMLEGETNNKLFEQSAGFYVRYRAFTLQSDQVFSVYPHEYASGNFSNELPFIVLNAKTLPWQYDGGGDPRRPWLALIALGEDEPAEEKDISIRELLTASGDSFYPAGSQPECFLEDQDDMCHIIDISRELYDRVMPKQEETPYLCHGKYVNLAETAEQVSGEDGYFSVIVGNRFLPSDPAAAKKSTVHLVSLLGYEAIGSSGKVRLCSLYRWSVYSQSLEDTGFARLVKAIDSGPMGLPNAENGLLKRGVVVKEHRLRNGETTASLYCSPLLPAQSQRLDMSNRHTADGHLIYDKNIGVFDAKYACSWQLGRMITLADEPMDMNIFKWRRGLAAARHKRLLRANSEAPDFGAICIKMERAVKSDGGGEENETTPAFENDRK